MNDTIIETAIAITLNPANSIPIYRQIIQQIEYAVLAGRLKPGDKLPTIRTLAVDLKINPNTIVRAYNELEIRGILTTQVGSGTYISNQRPEPEDDTRRRKIDEVLNRFRKELRDLGVDTAQLIKLLKETPHEET
jgi:GntR family transcriptional regulator